VDPLVDKPTQEWAEMFPIGKMDKTDLTYQTFAKLGVTGRGATL
jgi:hypothetical protein